MKKFLRLFALLLLAALLPLSALSDDFDCEADPYLISNRWEMKVGNWGNTSTMTFYGDGTGIQETAVVYQSTEGNYTDFHCVDFTWTTVDFGGFDCYMILTFHGTPFGNLEWGTYHHPHRSHTYQLLWSPEAMYLIDNCHSEVDEKGRSTDRTIYLQNPEPKR